LQHKEQSQIFGISKVLILLIPKNKFGNNLFKKNSQKSKQNTKLF